MSLLILERAILVSVLETSNLKKKTVREKLLVKNVFLKFQPIISLTVRYSLAVSLTS